MTERNNQSIQLDIPQPTLPKEYRKDITWCEAHWADLMFALNDRGLASQIAVDNAALDKKLASGKGDPCWEAFTSVSVGAIQIFGIEKVINEHGGCPVCAFRNIVSYAADIVTRKYGSTH